MFKSWRIGRIFGVPTDLHWSFLLVPMAIFFYAYDPVTGIAWRQVQWWSGVTLLLFGFVLVHELGHALMARNRGVEAEKIILFPLGGGALIPSEPERTFDEVLVYFAGPLANMGLALVVLPILLLQPNGEYLLRFYLNPFGNLIVAPTLTEQLLGLTIGVNALLAAGNLLPAYPLDGGRILRALLKRPIGERRATIVTTLLGISIGGMLVYFGLTISDPLLVMSAAFIVVLSVVEFNRGWQRRWLGRRSLKVAWRPPIEPRLYATDSLRRARRLFTRLDYPILPVHNSWNELSGFLARESLPRSTQESEAIRHLYEAEFVTATVEENLLEVTERIVQADVYGAAIYQQGKIVGYVFTEDVIRMLDETPRRFYRRLKSRV